jgi:L-ascorbate metabolism protein UlaG (beta-lactamase superfamily)
VQRGSSLGLKRLAGVHEWDSSEFRGIRLTAVPAQHTGGELGLIVEGERTLYFAGDTSLDRDLFRTIGHRWKLDAVLLPIGDLHSLGLPFGHISPRRAPRALRLLGEPPVVVPTHYSGMTLGPFMYFGGTPRKLSEAIYKAELGTLLGTTRPLEMVEL